MVAKKSAKGGSASGGKKILKVKKTSKPAKKKVVKKPAKKSPKTKAHKTKAKTALKQTGALTVTGKTVEMEKLLAKLMEKGAERSFVTEAEILHTFPNFEDDITGLELVMDALDKRGIEVVDQEVASVWE